MSDTTAAAAKIARFDGAVINLPAKQ